MVFLAAQSTLFTEFAPTAGVIAKPDDDEPRRSSGTLRGCDDLAWRDLKQFGGLHPVQLCSRR